MSPVLRMRVSGAMSKEAISRKTTTQLGPGRDARPPLAVTVAFPSATEVTTPVSVTVDDLRVGGRPLRRDRHRLSLRIAGVDGEGEGRSGGTDERRAGREDVHEETSTTSTEAVPESGPSWPTICVRPGPTVFTIPEGSTVATFGFGAFPRDVLLGNRLSLLVDDVGLDGDVAVLSEDLDLGRRHPHLGRLRPARGEEDAQRREAPLPRRACAGFPHVVGHSTPRGPSSSSSGLSGGDGGPKARSSMRAAARRRCAAGWAR